MFRRHRIAAVLGVVITVGLLTWAFRGVSLAEAWEHIQHAHPGWLLAMIGFATLTFPLRALRWAWLLPKNPGHTDFNARMGAVSIGFMANNVLPVRLGELATAAALSRSSPVRASAALGSLVVERVFDGLMLTSFLVVALLFSDASTTEAEGSLFLRQVAWVGGGVFATAWATLWLLVRHADTAFALYDRMAKRLIADRFASRLRSTLSSFIEGLQGLYNLGIFPRVLAWSLAVWLTAALGVWAGLLAFDIHAPGPIGAFFVLSMIGFAVAVPSSLGFVGPLEAACRIGLEVYHVEPARIASFAVTYHVLTFAPITLIGLWYLRKLGFGWRELKAVGGGVGANEAPPRTGPAPIP